MFMFCVCVFAGFFVFVFCSDNSCRDMQCNRDAEMQEFLCFVLFLREFFVFVFCSNISCREMQ